jgi:hypothetical protein
MCAYLRKVSRFFSARWPVCHIYMKLLNLITTVSTFGESYKLETSLCVMSTNYLSLYLCCIEVVNIPKEKAYNGPLNRNVQACLTSSFSRNTAFKCSVSELCRYVQSSK